VRVLIVVIVGLFALPLWAVAAVDTIPEEHAVEQYPSKMGVVTFNHALHAALRTNSCETCHHAHQPGEPFQVCSDCHRHQMRQMEDGGEVPKTSKAFHLRCRGCHEYTVQELHKPAGPTKCKLCHIKVTD